MNEETTLLCLCSICGDCVLIFTDKSRTRAQTLFGGGQHRDLAGQGRTEVHARGDAGAAAGLCEYGTSKAKNRWQGFVLYRTERVQYRSQSREYHRGGGQSFWL